MSHRRRGSTLLELLITLAIMAIVSSVVALALRPKAALASDDLALLKLLNEARRSALTQRRPVTIDVVSGGTMYAVTALPDGGVLADSALHIDRLTGERLDARP